MKHERRKTLPAPRRPAFAAGPDTQQPVPIFDWQDFDAYLFDIDGTLLNSDDAVHYNAFRLALGAIFGIESRLDNIPVHGNTDIGILRAAVSLAGKQADFESKLAAALALICEQVERNKKHLRPRLCPAITELLQRLRSQGKVIGVVTGNLESVGRAKLQAASLDRYFSLGAFCDSCETRSKIFRLGIQQARDLLSTNSHTNAICIVGDTPADIFAARANQVPIIAVATGIYPFEDLARHHPGLCLHSCEELLRT